MNKLVTICLIPLVLAACDKKEILPGKREAISGITSSNIDANTKINSRDRIVLTMPITATKHITTAGNDQHNACNNKLPLNSKQLWQVSVGRGPINSDIIIENDKIYAVDAYGVLSIVSASDGSRLNHVKTWMIANDEDFEGSITTGGNLIYVASVNKIEAYDKDLNLKLSRDVDSPIKSKIFYTQGKIIVTTIDNQTITLDAKTLTTLWTDSKAPEKTVMAGSCAPSVYQDSVIVPYTTGDITRINLSSGSNIWEETLFSSDMASSGSVISHISVSPIVFDTRVLVANSESKMVMFDADTGSILWTKSIGTINTPSVNSGWIFALTSNKTLVCLNEKDGQTKWQVSLDDLYTSEKLSSDIVWFDPLLINGDIVLSNSQGDLLTLDVSTGALKDTNRTGLRISRTPVVVNNKMYIVTNQANIHAFG
ncbi:MAG: PQQ-like beta-propeller repeat protein [Alphaproteobacteria bacterium]|nr:PQQ-like beta-propeller repeat protein [Alphaproteobacteria bacterium]